MLTFFAGVVVGSFVTLIVVAFCRAGSMPSPTPPRIEVDEMKRRPL